jgi:hypothetical protein
MTQKTENRIWRGLFLAAIAGVGLAAASSNPVRKCVSGWNHEGFVNVLTEGGDVFVLSPETKKWVLVNKLPLSLY